jgi:uncharacterized protein
MTERMARRTVDGELIEWLDVPARAAALGLEPHPEGGWYRRTWAAGATLEANGGVRPAATLIHFLLPPGESSAWHRVESDEIWMWHGPDPLVLELGGTGDGPVADQGLVLGPGAGTDPEQHAQVLVPAGVWQRTIPSDGEVLVSCLVSPGFSFDDFSLA